MDILQTKEADSKLIRVLSLNTWLLKTPIGLNLVNHVEERLKILPAKIHELNPDIISFQEVWNYRHRQFLVHELKKYGYEYHAYRADVNGRLNPLEIVRSGFGNGLLIFSKFEMAPEIEQLRFSTFTRADERAVMKGAIKSRIKIPSLGWVDFFNAHLGAVSFDKHSQEYNKSHQMARLQQARELTEFIGTQASQIQIAALDLDVHYHQFQNGRYIEKLTPEYELLTQQIPLLDTYREKHGFAETPHWTFSSSNPYVSGGHFSHVPNEVIDYIFVNKNPKLKPIESKLVFTEPLQVGEGKRMPQMLSDHYGVFTTFEMKGA